MIYPRQRNSDQPSRLPFDSLEPLAIYAAMAEAYGRLTGRGELTRAVKCRRCRRGMVGIGQCTIGTSEAVIVANAREVAEVDCVAVEVEAARVVKQRTIVTCPHCAALNVIHPRR